MGWLLKNEKINIDKDVEKVKLFRCYIKLLVVPPKISSRIAI